MVVREAGNIVIVLIAAGRSKSNCSVSLDFRLIAHPEYKYRIRPQQVSCWHFQRGVASVWPVGVVKSAQSCVRRNMPSKPDLQRMR